MINKSFSKVILQMREIDQDLRLAAVKAQKDPSKPDFYRYVVYLTDIVHSLKIHQLVSRYGYPTKKTVGVKALKAFWLLIQHQDLDPELQQVCLEYCDFASQEHAYLTDRVLVNSGEKQRYGTQFGQNKKTGQVELRPLEDLKKVHELRAVAGLETLQEYERKYMEFHKNIQTGKKKSK